MLTSGNYCAVLRLSGWLLMAVCCLRFSVLGDGHVKQGERFASKEVMSIIGMHKDDAPISILHGQGLLINGVRLTTKPSFVMKLERSRNSSGATVRSISYCFLRELG